MKISVGICAYNEEKNIGHVLNNLLTLQDLPMNTDIIVVCSGCTDSTPQIVRSFENYDVRIKLLVEKERRGKAHALNRIFVYASSSDVLILTNADAYPEPGSLMKLVRILDNSKAGAATGRPVPLNKPSSLPGMVVQLIWDLHHKICINGSVKMSGELCAIRRSLLETIPTNLATDEPYMEMLIRRKGHSIVYLPEAVVRIKGPENLGEILKHRKRIWSGHLQIKCMEGFAVSTSDFRTILSTLVRNQGYALKQFRALTLLVTIDMLSYLQARYILRKGEIPFIWEVLQNTKNLGLGAWRDRARSGVSKS